VAVIPVGQFSEEAQESRNKDRKCLEEFVRKKYLSHQRKLMFLIYFWFPPVHLRRLPKEATKTYLPEALQLFAVPKVSENLGSFSATTTEVDSNDTSEEISI